MWMALSVLCVLAAVFLTAVRLRIGEREKWLVIGLTVVFFPLRLHLERGQIDAYILFVLTLAFFFELGAGADWASYVRRFARLRLSVEASLSLPPSLFPDPAIVAATVGIRTRAGDNFCRLYSDPKWPVAGQRLRHRSGAAHRGTRGVWTEGMASFRRPGSDAA